MEILREIFGGSWAYLLAFVALVVWWAGQKFWRK